ncbi:MAG: FecR domain-containing protein [Novosphingobium sp.]|nr:FecR domain-containing protein [Novosphingobium sp.]MCP5401499.1 FecR domain-containing protein [Novosphingobium sp.]
MDAPVATRRIPAWTRWAGAAIAATLAAILALPQFLPPSPVIYETTSASRMVALEDGSSVMLAPHSRLEVKGERQERMALNGGAWFDIRHDPSRPLAIRAGGVEISDIGTRFDVQAAGEQVRVEVAQGEVKVSSEALAQPIRLTQGRGLSYDAKVGTALVSTVRPDAIGEWRTGRLTYDSAPLALVAEDLSRYAGIKVTVADDLRNRQFSGTLVIDNGEAALRDLSRLMGIDLVPGTGGYRLDDHSR